jgi:hypothetical protein
MVAIRRVLPVVEETGELVEVPGFWPAIPDPLTLDMETDSDEFTVRVRYGVGPTGAFLCQSLALTAASSSEQGIDSTALRSVRIRQLDALATTYAVHCFGMLKQGRALQPATVARGGDDAAGPDDVALEYAARLDLPRETTAPAPLSAARVRELRRMGPSSDEVAELVGELYRFAEATGRAPTKYLQDHLGIPQATASNWIKRARAAGRVPAARRRTPKRDE